MTVTEGSRRGDWRVLGGVASAWFGAGSLPEAAALAVRVVERAPDAAVDLRVAGLRVRAPTPEDAAVVSSLARDAGLAADPTGLQRLEVLLRTTDPGGAARFWARALGHVPEPSGRLVDPLGRDLELRLEPAAAVPPLRDRFHLDVVRPSDVVAAVGLGAGGGPYGLRHVDPERNEVDVVPGDGLPGDDATADWRTVFSAIACYRTASSAQGRALVVAAADAADRAGFPLAVDVRPGLVVLDTGKDRWEAEAHGLDVDVAVLAADLQREARRLGAVADTTVPRFVQVVVDVADLAAARAFWTAVLGYTADRRAGVGDLVDPRLLGPVLVLQDLDLAETDRRRQRNRAGLRLEVPAEVAHARVAAGLATGGRLVDERPDRWGLADPDGNEVVVVGV